MAALSKGKRHDSAHNFCSAYGKLHVEQYFVKELLIRREFFAAPPSNAQVLTPDFRLKNSRDPESKIPSTWHFVAEQHG
jgi:hypothetical protein